MEPRLFSADVSWAAPKAGLPDLTPHSPVTRSEAHRMRTLLVPIEQHHSINSVLDTAFLFARRFESYVEGVALVQSGSSVVSADVAVSLPSPDDKGQNATIER